MRGVVVTDPFAGVGEPPGAEADFTTLVVNPRTKSGLTTTRETDARTALLKGLAEYVARLEMEWGDGERLFFQNVLHTWSEPEDPASYPSAIVYAVTQGTYEASHFNPEPHIADDGETMIREAAEYTLPIQVEAWANSPEERQRLSAMLEDAFDPVDWMTGFRLRLPHYHSTHADFLKLQMDYQDAQETAERRHRRAIFNLRGTVVQLVAAGPKQRIHLRTDVQVEDSGC